MSPHQMISGLWLSRTVDEHDSHTASYSCYVIAAVTTAGMMFFLPAKNNIDLQKKFL
jgi:hypothetical protein